VPGPFAVSACIHIAFSVQSNDTEEDDDDEDGCFVSSCDLERSFRREQWKRTQEHFQNDFEIVPTTRIKCGKEK
jgi:hypothetical protein